MLPFELIDHIFQFLRNDISALRKCSKTHPVFGALAERHIYANIVVNNGDIPISELRRQFSENPHIMEFVCSMTIDVSEIFSTSMLQETLEILSMLPQMVKLASIEIYGPLRWCYLYESFRALLEFALRRSSASAVCIRGIYGFPLSALNNCKQLTLNYCAEFTNFVSSSAHPHLEELVIDSCDEQDLLSWARQRVTNLTSLVFRRIRNFTAFSEFLSACSSSLTSLYLSIGNLCQTRHIPGFDGVVHEGVEFPFTLSQHNRLQTLVICALVFSTECTSDEASDHHSVFYSAIPAIAQLIKTAPSLQQVILRIHCDLLEAESLLRLDWTPLVRLADLPTCPQIDLCISGRGTESLYAFSPSEVVSAFENHDLMRLVKRGLLDIKPETKSIEGFGDFR